MYFAFSTILPLTGNWHVASLSVWAGRVPLPELLAGAAGSDVDAPAVARTPPPDSCANAAKPTKP